jgi:hypothetical protein
MVRFEFTYLFIWIQLRVRCLVFHTLCIMLLLYKGARGYAWVPFFLIIILALCVFSRLSLFVVCFFSRVVWKLIIVSLRTLAVLLPFPLLLFPFALLQFPFTLWLLFLSATIVTCFRSLLLHIGSLFCSYFNLLELYCLHFFHFVRQGLEFGAFLMIINNIFLWHDFFLKIVFSSVLFFNKRISLLLWLYLVLFCIFGFVQDCCALK